MRPYSLKTCLAALALAAFGSQAMGESVPPQFLGHWVGPGLDKVTSPGGTEGYIRRSVTFTEEKETLRLEAFGDPDGKVPLFTYESTGPYKVLGPSATVSGAMEINLTNDSSTVTAFVDDAGLWQGLNLAGCKLVIGQPVEISGCASGPPFNTSSCVDQDLVQIDSSGALRFGDQTVDRCVSRPEKLNDASFVRAAR